MTKILITFISIITIFFSLASLIHAGEEVHLGDHQHTKFSEVYVDFENQEAWIEVIKTESSFNQQVSIKINFDDLENNFSLDLNSCDEEFCVFALDFENFDFINLSSNFELDMLINDQVLESFVLELDQRQKVINAGYLQGELTFLDYPTKGVENNYRYESVVLSEIYAAPDTSLGETEWVEIYNYSQDIVDLDGWYLSEELLEERFCKENKEFAVNESEDLYEGDVTSRRLLAQGFLLIPQSDLHITLNNSGDEVYLCNHENKLIDEIIYSESEKHVSISREFKINDEVNTIVGSPWKETPFLTPEKENKFEEPLEIMPISNLTNISNGEKVKVEGVVTLYGDFYDDVIIQDETGAVILEISSNLKINDQIVVEGVWYKNKNSIEVTDYKKVSKSFNLPLVQPMHQNINKSLLKLVQVEGEIIDNYASSFDILLGDDVIRISIGHLEKIEKSKGDMAKVSGVLVWDDDVYRLHPRSIDEVQITKVLESSSKAKKLKSVKVLKSQSSRVSKLQSDQVLSHSDSQDYSLPNMSVVRSSSLNKSHDNINEPSTVSMGNFLISSSIVLGGFYYLLDKKYLNERFKKFQNIQKAKQKETYF